MRTKRILAISCILALLVGAMLTGMLSGCTPAAEKITIEVLTWHGPDSATKYYAGYLEMAKNYMKTHKNVVIKIKYEADGTYGNILETGFAGGTAPDIIQMKSAQRSTFSANLLDLRAMLNEASAYDTRNAKWIDNFVGGEGAFPAEKSGDVETAFLFVPNDGNPDVYTGNSYIFNSSLVKKAGLDPKTTPKTWKEMFTWLEALKKNTAIDPIAGSSDVGGKVSQLGYAFGVKYADKFFDSAITDAAFAGDLWWDKLYALTCYEKGSAMALDNLAYYPAMMALMKQHLGYYQPSWYENTAETEKLTFASGKAALMVTAFWDYSTLASALTKDKFPDGYGLFPIPYFGADTLAYCVEKGWITQAEADAAAPYAVTRPSAGGGSGRHEYGFTVNKKTAENAEKLAVVKDFLMYMTSKTTQDKYVVTAQSLSPVKDVALIDMMKQFIVPEPDGGFVTDILGYTVVEWGKSGWDVEMIKYLKGEQDWQTTIAAVSAPEWKGDIPTVEALQTAVDTAQTDLDAAADADKEGKQHALDAAKLRQKLYVQYYYDKTGNWTELG